MRSDLVQGPEITDSRLPFEPGVFARLHRERVIDAAGAFSAIATLGYGAFYYIGGAQPFLFVNLAASIGFLGVSLARRTNVQVRLYLGETVGLALFGIQLVLVGGVINGITPWLLLPPIMSVIIGDRRLAAYSTAVAIAEPSLVVLASQAKLISPSVTLPAPDVLMLVSLVGIIAICAAFAYISNDTRARLQREVDARTVALASALEAAQLARGEAVAAAHAKDRFIANLNHEIRTPLTGIAGSAELLAGTDLSGEQRDLADALLASTRSLTALVNAILDHARLAAGHTALDVAEVAPREIVRGLEAMYRPAAEERGLGFVVRVSQRVPEVIQSDGIRLGQVLANLVGNAVKFTDRGAVRLALDWVPGVDGQRGTLVAAVADTGPGIPPDQQEAVFEPFVQGDASIRRTHGGTGLGLAISKQLVELLGGSIDLAAEVGIGSTFTVRVPAGAPTVAPSAVADPGGHEAQRRPETPRPAADDRGGPRDAAGPTLAGLRILLVEDNDVNRRVVGTMLRRSGAEVVAATDGRAAVELAASNDLDLVLMDLQMPGLDGIEATRRIRAAEVANGTPRLPIVAMTGNALEDYGEACEAAGMDGFITKPATADQLRAIVARTAVRN